MYQEEHRRGTFELILEILRICRQPATKTRIVYHANLNFVMMKGYVNRLLEKDLLKAEGKGFKTTEKGLRLLEQGREIIPLICA